MQERPDLDAIEARCKAATEGPWNWDSGDIGEDYSVPYCSVFHGEGSVVVAEINDCVAENATFIAHARQDIPALLAYCRRLETRVSELDTELENAMWSSKESRP